MAQVTFQGHQVLPQGVLREAVHGTAIGMPYTESGFREMLNNSVRPVYEQRGRVRVAFPEIRVWTEDIADARYDPRTKLLAAIHGEPQRRAEWP